MARSKSLLRAARHFLVWRGALYIRHIAKSVSICVVVLFLADILRS